MWNFPPVERLRSHPLPAALLAAAALHALAAPLLLQTPRRSLRLPASSSADDAPLLLRLGASLQSRLNADLATQRRPLALALPAPAALSALPPPPPPLETLPSESLPARAAGPPRGAAGPAASAGSAARPGPGGGIRDDRLLPTQPEAALRLALAWSPGRFARESAGDTTNQAFTEAGLELRRRQLLLTSTQAQQLQRILQAAAPLPAPFGDLPEGVTVRRVGADALAPLGLGQLHGVSLLRREALVLLWRDGGDLLLLQQPLE